MSAIKPGDVVKDADGLLGRVISVTRVLYMGEQIFVRWGTKTHAPPMPKPDDDA